MSARPQALALRVVRLWLSRVAGAVVAALLYAFVAESCRRNVARPCGGQAVATFLSRRLRDRPDRRATGAEAGGQNSTPHAPACVRAHRPHSVRGTLVPGPPRGKCCMAASGRGRPHPTHRKDTMAGQPPLEVAIDHRVHPTRGSAARPSGRTGGNTHRRRARR